MLNEYISIQLANHCGLSVPDVALRYFGDHPALLVKRFDRQMVSSSEIKRRHIIDGCQALNLPPDYKYERNFGSSRDVAHIREGASYTKLFEFANQCANPALTKQKILDWALFNLLIFNFDVHGKNISFFVGAKGTVLAPFYDLVNISMYSQFDNEMAMALGDEFDSGRVNAYQLADFADSCHLSRSLVAKRLKSLISKLKDALTNESFFEFKNTDEQDYFKKYQTRVIERCAHLSSQADEIVSIDL